MGDRGRRAPSDCLVLVCYLSGLEKPVFAAPEGESIFFWGGGPKPETLISQVAAVASNNLFSLRGKETNLFDSAKKAKALNLDDQAPSPSATLSLSLSLSLSVSSPNRQLC